MGNSTSDIKAWVASVFDHPVADPAWYWEEDAMCVPESAHTLEMLAAVYTNPVVHLGQYSDAQVNQGLWYLTNPTLSNASFGFFNEKLPVELRCRGLAAIPVLFRCLFAPKCSHTFEEWKSAQASPLDSICFMWWDLFPAYNARRLTRERDLCLDAMSQALRLESVTCQLAGLHGLGHWEKVAPRRVEGIIDGFLRSRPRPHPEVAKYARLARGGCIE